MLQVIVPAVPGLLTQQLEGRSPLFLGLSNLNAVGVVGVVLSGDTDGTVVVTLELVVVGVVAELFVEVVVTVVAGELAVVIGADVVVLPLSIQSLGPAAPQHLN